MGFNLFKPAPTQHKLKEVYSIREVKNMCITECKLILDDKQISYGLSRIEKVHFNVRVGKEIALAKAAKIFFKSMYELEIIDHGKTDNFAV